MTYKVWIKSKSGWGWKPACKSVSPSRTISQQIPLSPLFHRNQCGPESHSVSTRNIHTRGSNSNPGLHIWHFGDQLLLVLVQATSQWADDLHYPPRRLQAAERNWGSLLCELPESSKVLQSQDLRLRSGGHCHIFLCPLEHTVTCTAGRHWQKPQTLTSVQRCGTSG